MQAKPGDHWRKSQNTLALFTRVQQFPNFFGANHPQLTTHSAGFINFQSVFNLIIRINVP